VQMPLPTLAHGVYYVAAYQKNGLFAVKKLVLAQR